MATVSSGSHHWQYLLLAAALLLASKVLLLTAVDLIQAVVAKRNAGKRRALIEELGHSPSRTATLVGLFHPYCNAGGGGERVLWAAVACLQREEPDVICLVYTGDIDASRQEIVDKVKARFSIVLDPTRLHLVYLGSRYLVEDTAWPRFTLLGQSLGSILLAHQGLSTIIPDVFIDTMGYAFTFPLVRLYADIPVGAYVHYPTISTNMLQRVKDRSAGHTNSSSVTKSFLLSYGKLCYYKIFAMLYSFCLGRARFIMTNSSWTQGHVNTLLGIQTDPTPGSRSIRLVDNCPRGPWTMKVYPPCDTTSLSALPLQGRDDRMILSVAQFRPEKEHATQLRVLRAYYDANPRASLLLTMAGSVRNKGDEERLAGLKELAKDLGLSSKVNFVVNPSWPELVALFGRASIGLSTMVDEHFGINVVEFMAAGLIPLVHASGGPLLDIVVEHDGQPTGFHALTPAEYADRLEQILELPSNEASEMRRRARDSAIRKFSEVEFDQAWMQAWRVLTASRSPS